MGSSPEVGFDRFPAQSDILGKVCRVSFHEDPSRTISGTVVRADVEPEECVIIRLDDGRLVLDSECEFGFSDNWTPISSHKLDSTPNDETNSVPEIDVNAVGTDGPHAQAPFQHGADNEQALKAPDLTGHGAEDETEAHPT